MSKYDGRYSLSKYLITLKTYFCSKDTCYPLTRALYWQSNIGSDIQLAHDQMSEVWDLADHPRYMFLIMKKNLQRNTRVH